MGKQSGTNTSTVIQNPTIPDWLSTQFQNLATRAETVSNTPFNPATQKNVADFTPDQLQSFQQTRDNQGIYQPYMNAATGYAEIGGSTIGGDQINQYMNPFQQNVIDATMGNIQQNNAIQQANLRGNIALQGGLGNDRGGLARAELARNQNLATNQTLANLNAQNYNQALGAAQADRGAAQQAATQFGNIGANMQALAGRDTAALQTQGGVQQALTQQQLDTTSANAASQEQYPFATTQWFGNVLQGGSAPFQGTQSTTSSPAPSTLSQIAGLGMLGAGIFGNSDERLKENIELIGQDNAGNNIYRYNFKGSPKTEIGYLAQEIAETNPDAVMEGDDGYLKVDYHEVTEDAVGDHDGEREGFSDGGFTIGGNRQYNGRSGLRGAQTGGADTPMGVSSIVPQSAVTAAAQMGAMYPVKKMAPPSRARSMVDEAKEIAGDLPALHEAGKSVNKGLGGLIERGSETTGEGGWTTSVRPEGRGLGNMIANGLGGVFGMANGGRAGYALGGQVYGPAAEMIPGAPTYAGAPTPYGQSNIVPPAPQPAMRRPAGLGAAAMPAVPMDAQDGPGTNPTMGLGAPAGSYHQAQRVGMPSDGGQTIAGSEGTNSLTGSAGTGGLGLSEAARMGLIQAGLGTLGGTSPHAGVNIGRGAAAGIPAYQQAKASEAAAAQRAMENAIAQKQLDMAMQTFKAEQEARKAEQARNAVMDPINQRSAEAEMKLREAQAAQAGRKIVETDGSVIEIMPDRTSRVLYQGTPKGEAATNDMREYNFARQQGFEGSFLDWQREKMAAKEKPRQFNFEDVQKLEKEGEKFSQLNDFSSTFKDDFAGYTTGGATAMWAGRQGLPFTPRKEAVGFWQGYDRYRNTVRNELFGAALTAPEKEEFEKTDINPNMDPEVIKENLERQKQIVKRGLKKKAEAYIEAGYPPSVIAKAYGLDPEKDLGVSGRGQTAPKTTMRDFDDAAAIPEGKTVRDNQTGKMLIKRNGKLEPVN